jgi:hypothetical protein
MEIIDFEPGLTAEWDAFVRQHPLAGYGHLSANFALAAATPGLRNVSLLIREGKTVLGVLPLFESGSRTLRSIAVRQLVSGAFFPAGPLISTAVKGKAETNTLGLMLETVRARARGCGADRVLMSHPYVTGGQPTISRIGYSPLLHHGYRSRPGVGLILDLTQPVERLAAARNSGCRQRITKAQAAGVTTGVIRDRAEWMACHRFNVETLGPLAHSERQLEAMWDHFIEPGHATARGVYADGAGVAVTVAIHCNATAYYWHGWRRQTPVPGAGNLGLWCHILASREEGCRSFELGSLEFEDAKNIGISQFKQSFGGTPFQTVAAELDMKPVKSAAIAFAQAALTRVRQRGRNEAPAAAPPA